MSFFDHLEEYNIKYSKCGEEVTIHESLFLSYTSITQLPDNLSVGRDLDLSDISITQLPDNLSVGNILSLNAKVISNIAYRENCGKYNRTIFAAYVNGEIQIAADCFLGNIKKFESAVDKKYSDTDAEKYKQTVRECIKELEEMKSH